MSDQSPIYLIGDRAYLRPSRILQVMRDPEYPEEPDPAVYRQAERLGVKLHAVIEAYLLTGAVRQSQLNTPEAQMAWQAFRRWQEAARPVVKPILGQPPVELLVHAPSVGVACRLDFWDQRPVLDIHLPGGFLTDWKVKRRLTRKDRIKLNANWFILREWWEQQPIEANLLLPDKLRLVRLDKTVGDYQEEVFDPDQKLWETFLHLKEAYQDLYDEELQGAINDRGQDDSRDE